MSLLALLVGCGGKPPVQAAHARKSGAGLTVRVENRSQPVLCAEEDNVTIATESAEVRSFRIEVAPPVYAAMLQRDSTEPDWTACDMSQDPAHPASVAPRVQTLYEDAHVQLVGHTLPTFWRPSTARLRIGDRVEEGIHMFQVWLRNGEAREEVLVMYPQDGYFRARPRPIAGFGEIAYGSSFLVGPIGYEGRPIVRFEEVAFDPDTRTFTLKFTRGGTGRVRMLEVTSARHALDVHFDRAVNDGPFAMLRSMYITEFNNDVARFALREQGARGWREGNIMELGQARATDVWMGRLSPSQHNTSSPDTIFRGFSSSEQPHQPDASRGASE